MTLLDYGYPVYDILLISSQRPLNYSPLSTGEGILLKLLVRNKFNIYVLLIKRKSYLLKQLNVFMCL